MKFNEFMEQCYSEGVRDLEAMQAGKAATAFGLWAREHPAAVAGGLCSRPDAIEYLAIAVGDYYEAVAAGDRAKAQSLRMDIAEFHLRPTRVAAAYSISMWLIDRAKQEQAA